MNPHPRRITRPVARRLLSSRQRAAFCNACDIAILDTARPTSGHREGDNCGTIPIGDIVCHSWLVTRPSLHCRAAASQRLAVGTARTAFRLRLANHFNCRPHRHRNASYLSVATQHDEPRFTPQTSTNWHDLPWTRIVVAVHGIGTVCVFAWLSLGAWQRAVSAQCPTRASGIERVLGEIAALQNITSHLPELKISDRVDVAVALGIFRPTVLLPTNWLKSLAPDQLRTVLAHELAHVANHDLGWLAASLALLMLLWAQPLLWIVRRRMRLDQEALADAAAAELTSRRRYAEQLVAWARHMPARPAMHLSAAVGLWEGPSQLRQRIGVLLDDTFTVFRQCSRRWRMATLAMSGLTAMLLSIVTLEKAQSKPGEEPSQPSVDSNSQPGQATNSPPQSQSRASFSRFGNPIPFLW